MAYGKTVIHYDGTNLGPVYLKDCGQRSGLGGGRGIYVNGQDKYVEFGTDATLISTSDVMLSNSVIGPDRTGVIKHMVDMGAFHVTIV